MAGNMRMIILAAGQGIRLRPLTDDRPKCLVELCGRPLLRWQIDTARSLGIRDIVVIGGYRHELLNNYDVELVLNPDFASTNMVRTLFRARKLFGSGFVMSYGDIVYSPAVLRRVLEADVPIAVAVDRAWRGYWEQRFDDPLSDAETLGIDATGGIVDIGRKPRSFDEIMAQYIGLVAFRSSGVAALLDAYAAAEVQQQAGDRPFGGTRSLDQLYMTDLLQGLIARGERLAAVAIEGGWVEIDSPRDLEVAARLVTDGRLEDKSHG
jgi:L-glutamine-phosphate cytidylyltransferase